MPSLVKCWRRGGPVIKWLSRYKAINQEIAVIEIDIGCAEIEYYRWKDGDLSKTQSFEVLLLKQRELSQIIEDKKVLINKLKEQSEAIEKTVEKFKGIHNLIVRERYIHGKSIVEIAEEHNYSEQYIYNKHAEIKKILSYTES